MPCTRLCFLTVVVSPKKLTSLSTSSRLKPAALPRPFRASYDLPWFRPSRRRHSATEMCAGSCGGRVGINGGTREATGLPEALRRTFPPLSCSSERFPLSFSARRSSEGAYDAHQAYVQEGHGACDSAAISLRLPFPFSYLLLASFPRRSAALLHVCRTIGAQEHFTLWLYTKTQATKQGKMPTSLANGLFSSSSVSSLPALTTSLSRFRLPLHLH